MSTARRLAAILTVTAGLGGSALGQTTELRGWWVDASHPGLRSAAEVDQLVSEARLANLNSLFVQVRKRGDAYYHSRFEPWAAEVEPGFDPLAHLVERAHETNTGPRLEVHAWMVTYRIWDLETSFPPHADHPYRLHPDWLTESFDGETWNGSDYALEPGHPAVQEHTFNVAMDIVSRYDVDGLHFDDMRYAGREWGYHPTAIARFNAATGSTGRPTPDDSWWMRWRRDQVTGVLRRVYLAAAALKPQVRISATTVTGTPTATSFSSWLQSEAWSHALQDWRGWMEEGILDLNVPMAYFPQETHASAWYEWSRFAKENRFNRHLALGVGGYLNTISNTIVQMKNTRTSTSGTAQKADGVLVRSYAVPARDGVPRSDFITALTTSTANAPGQPVFLTAAKPPAMPWKTNRTLRGIGGVITDARTGQPIEGAQVELSCSTPAFLLTDANGAFGRLVEYAPVTAVVSAPGYATQLHDWSEQRRDLVATNFALEPDTSDLRALDLRVTPGRKSVLVSWRTEAPSRGRVIYGLDSLCGSGGIQVDSRLGTRHVVLIGSLYAGATDDPMEYWLRVVSDSPERGTNYSHAVRIVPAMWPIPAGEWDVRLTGEWTFVPTSQAGPPQGFWRAFITSGGPTPTAIWSVPIEVTGNYDIQFWTSGNYANSYDVHTVRTNFTVNVQQPPPGQLLRPLATNVFLLRGERPEVRLVNPGFTSYLLAGHMSWVYREGQDPPPPNTLPAWWAEHFFREPVDPLADPDADGFSNYSEFGFGTDPTDPDSQLRLRLEADPEDGWQLVFSPVTGGRTYSLQRADDLTSGIWETAPIHSWVVTPLPSGEWSVAVASPQAGPQFYRLGVSF